MSKFVKNSIFLADSLIIRNRFEKNTKLNFLYFCSQKIKTISLFFNQLVVLKKKKYLLYIITEKKKKNVIGLLFVRLLRLVFDSMAANRRSLSVLGIGFNIIQEKTYLLFNVGTSQSIKWKIKNNVFFRILGKKQNQIKFYSISKQYLSDILISIIKLRQPNIYTGKGIYFHKLNFSTKIGKIKKI
jgi:ribosomal protein L6P/L9E